MSASLQRESLQFTKRNRLEDGSLLRRNWKQESSLLQAIGEHKVLCIIYVLLRIMEVVAEGNIVIVRWLELLSGEEYLENIIQASETVDTPFPLSSITLNLHLSSCLFYIITRSGTQALIACLHTNLVPPERESTSH